MDKQLLGMTELSEYLGLTKGTLYGWVCHKKIPYIKLGRLVKFSPLEIETWLKRKKVKDIA